VISKKLIESVKLSSLKSYEIAHKAEIHPSTLSKILNGIENVRDADPRVLRIGSVLGLRPGECFEKVSTNEPVE
jgi:hypothetical protein